MKKGTQIRYDHYRQLFMEARRARAGIRDSLGMPVAATAFTVFNLGILAQSFDPTQLPEPAVLAIGVLAVLAVLELVAAVYFIMRVEWHFVHVEPPDLAELSRIEQEIRNQHPDPEGPDPEAAVSLELRKTLTGSYYVGYENYLIGNALSARFRTWALRLVLLALLSMAAAFLVLLFCAPGMPA